MNKFINSAGAVLAITALLAVVLLALGLSDSIFSLAVPLLLVVVLVLFGQGATRFGMAGFAGSRVFSLEAWNPRTVTYQTANYTALLTDEQITMNGASLTLTLFLISSLIGGVTAPKVLGITNAGTTPLIVNPSASVDPTLNVANTIGGSSTFTVLPNQTIVIQANEGDGDWQIVSPYPVPALKQVYVCLSVITNGTTAVNVFDAAGAPCDFFVTGMFGVALDTTAGNITVTNISTAIVTAWAKSATAGLPTGPVGALTAAQQLVKKGSVFTAVSSSAGNVQLFITGIMQQYA